MKDSFRAKNLDIFFLFLGCFFLLLFLENGTAVAQGKEVQWQEPINLSNSFTSSTYPAIVADKYGYVHVFWGEDVGGEAINVAQPVEKSNSIMYSQWNGTTWSDPIDLFISQSGADINFPYAAIDHSGRINLVWQGYEGIYFSSAPVEKAWSVKAWQPAQLIVHARGNGPYLFADQEGGLRLIFPEWNNSMTGEKDGNIYYMSSSDGGQSWSDPLRLSNIPAQAEIQSGHPTIVMDGQKWLHAVWYQAEPPDWVGTSIYYARSEDGGQTWTQPLEIVRRNGNEKWASEPELALLPPSELHLTWVCGENAYRCHRWSEDGGHTWSTTEREFGNMLSLAGWDTLTVDGDGTLYWILQLRYPEAIYYSFWTGSHWSDLQIVNNSFLATGHYSRAVTSEGNQINLVVVDQAQKEIWYMRGITQARPRQPASTPTNEVPTEQPGTIQPSLPVTTMVATPFSSSIPPVVDQGAQDSFIIISVIPVLGLILGIIVFKKLLWRH